MTEEEKALARSDRYLAVVERLSLCPFARLCRESGKLERQVLPGSAGLLQAALGAVQRIEALPEESVEVGLLLFPGFASDLRAFEAFCLEVRAGCRDFFCVPFHPDLPEDLADEHRAVGFIRRAPDPTLQLVRKSLLERVRGEQGSVFVDASKLSHEQLMTLEPPTSLSDRIASDNLASVRKASADALRLELDAIRRLGR